MTTFLTGIPSQEIDEIWEACEPFIERAAKKGQSEMTSEDIYNQVFGNQQMAQLGPSFADGGIASMFTRRG